MSDRIKHEMLLGFALLNPTYDLNLSPCQGGYRGFLPRRGRSSSGAGNSLRCMFIFPLPIDLECIILFC